MNIYYFIFNIKNDKIKKVYKNNLDIKTTILKFSNYILKKYKIKILSFTVIYNKQKYNYKLIKKNLFTFIKLNNIVGGDIDQELLPELQKLSKEFNPKINKDDILKKEYSFVIDENVRPIVIVNMNLYDIIVKFNILLEDFIEDINANEKGIKQILVDLYNDITKKDISIGDFDFYKHFNYSETVKEYKKYKYEEEGKYKEKGEIIENLITQLDKIRKIFIIIFYKIVDEILCFNKQNCGLNNAGTVDKLSDYDITLKVLNDDAVEYMNILDIVDVYCKIFSKLLFINNTFDINIYTGEFKDIEEIKSRSIFGSKFKICIVEQCENLKYTNNRLPNFIVRQMRWSVERIYEYINTSKNEPIKDILKLKKILPSDEIKELKNVKDNFNKLIPFNDDDNREAYISEYIKKIKELLEEKRTIILELQTHKDDEIYIKNAISNIYNISCKILYLSNDAYYSSGAYIHIVGILQAYLNIDDTRNLEYIFKNFNKKLLINFYIMSFNDNLGFLLEKEYYYDNPNDRILKEDDKELKYIYRCFNAITIIYELLYSDNTSDFYKDKYIPDVNLEHIKHFYNMNIDNDNDNDDYFDIDIYIDNEIDIKIDIGNIMEYLILYIHSTLVKSKKTNKRVSMSDIFIKREDNKALVFIDKYTQYLIPSSEGDKQMPVIKMDKIKKILCKIYIKLYYIDLIERNELTRSQAKYDLSKEDDKKKGLLHKIGKLLRVTK